MIDNLIVSGCSFTELNDEYTSWSEIVGKHYNIKNYVNLGMGGAGNFYIANSVRDYLEFNQPDPASTLVLIMWSGVSRVDAKVSKEWWNLLEKQAYPFKAQQNYFNQDLGIDEHNYYVFGGQGGGSLTKNDIIKNIFSWTDKVSDPETVCKTSLVEFVNLENYLKTHRYNYRFTSFLNYWKPADIEKYGELSIGLNAQQTAMYKNFDFSNWFFINDKQDCFGEYAQQRNQLDNTNHPTGECHWAFANNIVIPTLKDLIK